MRAPRASANSRSSSTRIAAPSPSTNPSRSKSNGRLARSGSSLRARERLHRIEAAHRRRHDRRFAAAGDDRDRLAAARSCRTRSRTRRSNSRTRWPPKRPGRADRAPSRCAPPRRWTSASERRTARCDPRRVSGATASTVSSTVMMPPMPLATIDAGARAHGGIVGKVRVGQRFGRPRPRRSARSGPSGALPCARSARRDRSSSPRPRYACAVSPSRTR